MTPCGHSIGIFIVAAPLSVTSVDIGIVYGNPSPIKFDDGAERSLPYDGTNNNILSISITNFFSLPSAGSNENPGSKVILSVAV